MPPPIPLDTILLLLQDWFGLDDTFVHILKTHAIRHNTHIFRKLLITTPDAAPFSQPNQKALADMYKDIPQGGSILLRMRIGRTGIGPYRAATVTKGYGNNNATVQLLNSAPGNFMMGEREEQRIFAAQKSHESLFGFLAEHVS